MILIILQILHEKPALSTHDMCADKAGFSIFMEFLLSRKAIVR